MKIRCGACFAEMNEEGDPKAKEGFQVDLFCHEQGEEKRGLAMRWEFCDECGPKMRFHFRSKTNHLYGAVFGREQHSVGARFTVSDEVMPFVCDSCREPIVGNAIVLVRSGRADGKIYVHPTEECALKL